MLGTLLVFVLAADIHAVAGGQVHVSIDGALNVGYHGAHIATGHVGLDDYAALHVVAADLRRAGHQGYIRHLHEAHPGTVGGFQAQVADGLSVVAGALFQAHIDVVAFVAVDHLPGAAATEAIADQIHDLIDAKAIAAEGVTIRGDHQLGFPGYLFQLHVGGTVHGFHDLGDGFAFFLKHGQVRAEQLDGQLGFDAGEQFVHAHGDGLGKVEQQARMHVELLLNFFLQLETTAGAFPFTHRLEADVDFHVAHRLRIAADFRAPYPAECIGDFREGHDFLFQFFAHG